MKKKLLFIAALLGSTYAMAQTGIMPVTSDGDTYDTTNGITCECKWIYSRGLTPDVFTDSIGGMVTAIGSNYSRIAALDVYDSKIYVGWADGTEYNCAIGVFDFETGEYQGMTDLTLDGEIYIKQLGANNIIVDDFGHVVVIGYNGNIGNAPSAVFTVDPATGVLTQLWELELPAAENDAAGRIDYFDLIGDVTGEQAPCLIMGAANSDAIICIYRWKLEQGASEWVGDFDGWVSMLDITETYPAGQVGLGTAPTVKIINDNDEFSGDYYYVDGFTTCPTLYNTAGSMIESFESAPDLAPLVGTNGVNEFTIGDKNFVVYSEAQYDVTPGCRINVCELGPGMSFEGMELYWQLPSNGLGEISDGGNRVHCINTKNVTDANGKEAVYLMTYKGQNGLAVYLIAEEGFDDGSSKVESIDADIAAATISVVGKVITVSAEASDIAVYNIAGQKIAEVKNATEIAAPASGAYIVKAIVDGAAVVAKVII